MTIHAGGKHDMNWLLQLLKFKLKGVFFKHLMDQYPHFICYCIYKQYKKSEDLKSPHFQLITVSQSLNFAFSSWLGHRPPLQVRQGRAQTSPRPAGRAPLRRHTTRPPPPSPPIEVSPAMSLKQWEASRWRRNLIWANCIFWIVWKWEKCSGPTAAGQLPGCPLLLLPASPSALIHDAGTRHRLTIPWSVVKTFQIRCKSEPNEFLLKQRPTRQQSRIPTQAYQWNPPLPFTAPWWVNTTFLSNIGQKPNFGWFWHFKPPKYCNPDGGIYNFENRLSTFDIKFLLGSPKPKF